MTERKYFDKLRQEPFNYPLTFAPRDWDRTEPEEILNDLVRYRSQQERSRRKIDEYWIVFDHDDTKDHELKQVFKRAKKEKICVADSNPCFEVWLFQHFSPVQKFKGFAGDAASKGCSRVISELKRQFDKHYDKNKYNVSRRFM